MKLGIGMPLDAVYVVAIDRVTGRDESRDHFFVMVIEGHDDLSARGAIPEFTARLPRPQHAEQSLRDQTIHLPMDLGTLRPRRRHEIRNRRSRLRDSDEFPGSQRPRFGEKFEHTGVSGIERH